MQDTPKANRLHIGIFGCRNAGKSSLINKLTNQDIALVSSTPGTTTDPVFKKMEIPTIGPVVLIDTAGIDDVGSLGKMRVQKTLEVLRKTDIAIFVFDSTTEIEPIEIDFYKKLQEEKIPVIPVLNKSDLNNFSVEDFEEKIKGKVIPVSTKTSQGIEDLKKEIIKNAPSDFYDRPLIGDLIEPGETVLLVTPIDKAAPKGRLILPQVQTLRDILDHNGIGIVVKDTELKKALEITTPKIVCTDSQIFKRVAKITPPEVLLTSFSILFAREKGDLVEFVKGVKALKKLKTGDKVLISEACTHHRQADDIGKVKIPKWLTEYVGGELEFSWYSGGGYPKDLHSYKLVVHCGGCMINRKEMLYRIFSAKNAGVPIVNYGILIAFLHGVLDRALIPFKEAQKVWLEGEN